MAKIRRRRQRAAMTWLTMDEWMMLSLLSRRTDISRSRLLRGLVQWYREMDSEDPEEALRLLSKYLVQP